MVYISHDRYFINKTAQIILELSPEGITRYEGNYDYYLEKKAERARKEALLAAEQPVKGAAPAPVQTMTDTKSDWLKQKEQQAAERKLAAKIAKVEKAIEETERRRKIQQKYNEEHGITPQTIKKAVRDLIAISKAASAGEEEFRKDPESMDARELEKLAKELTKKMRQAAAELNFEEAAKLRDRMKEVKQMLLELEKN